MSFSIATNVVSLTAQRNLMRSTLALGTTFKRLSSG
ncbi:MAG: flagellin FliC, partial [Magnetococcales bacterium]|nr:flagellin FliC [Magnetococcales bacterium]